MHLKSRTITKIVEVDKIAFIVLTVVNEIMAAYISLFHASCFDFLSVSLVRAILSSFKSGKKLKDLMKEARILSSLGS